MKASSFIKSAVFVAAMGALSLTGCSRSGLEVDPLAPPAYTSTENAQRQQRYIAYDWSQVIEDFDKNVTMNRPASEMTIWHVRTSD